MCKDWKEIKWLLIIITLSSNGLSLKSFGQGVTLTENKSQHTIEIRNGLLGIVVPANESFQKQGSVPAPIQGFIFADNSYSDNTANNLFTPKRAVSMVTQVLTNSDKEASVRIKYGFNKDNYGDISFRSSGAGPGYYSCTITVKQNSKSILIEEDSDYDIVYSVKISNDFAPDKARYRGWSSEGLRYGYESIGRLYRSEDERQYPMDATVDLDYNKPFTYQKLTLWEPAGGELSTGRYWQLYNSQQDGENKLIGFLQGSPSRLIGGKAVGPALDILPFDTSNKEKNDAEIKMEIYRRGPDNSWFPRKRFQWAVFISTKNDLYPPDKIQPIGIELNKIAGLANVIHDYGKKAAKLTSGFYQGAIYMPADKVASLCSKVKNDNTFYNKMLQTEAGYQMLWDIWHSQEKAREMIAFLIEYKRKLEETYITGEGSYRRDIRYWKGSVGFKFYATLISCIFADKTIQLRPEEKSSLESLVAMMARILWNDNNVPLFDSSGINFGPANMPYQYRNDGRYFFALLLKDDPEFADRAHKLITSLKADINSSISDNGASFGSPHYTQAVIEPILFTMLQLKQSGLGDLFVTEKKIKSFAYFYLNLLTPPSCRFGNNRKLISFGDGSEESAACFALMATGFADVDTTLSRNLSLAYNFGPATASFHGLVQLAADTKISATKKFSLTTSSYNGYLTNYRYAVNTKDETAAWILNGELLMDHRNDDAGETAIYALGAPLSVSRSSFYYPYATDARIRSVVVPEKMFPSWSGGETPIEERSLTNRTWPSSTLLEFASLAYCNTSKVLMKLKDENEWYRQFTMLTIPGYNPIIIYYDSVKSGNAVWSMPMMSEGAITTPVGKITPLQRIYDYRNPDLKQIPINTAARTISAGINRFAFTGQHWPAHTSGGIDWYLYSFSTGNISFSVADWTTTWQNSLEQAEFQNTNHRPYSEEQQIFRLKSDRPFFTMLLPFNKGQDLFTNEVKALEGDEGFKVNNRNGSSLFISKKGYYFNDGNKAIIGAWNTTGQVNFEGFGFSGGVAELENETDKLFIRVHGSEGKRIISIPFAVKLLSSNPGISIITTQQGSRITIDYHRAISDISNIEKKYTEYSFSKNK